MKNGYNNHNKDAYKKTMRALKTDARPGGPFPMIIVKPDRLSKGKYKGTS